MELKKRQEVIPAYIINWEELEDEINKALKEQGFEIEYLFKPKTKSYSRHIPNIEGDFLVGTFGWEEQDLAFVYGFTISTTGQNIEDGVTIFLGDNYPLIDNINIWNDFVQLEKFKLVNFPDRRLNLIYNNLSGSQKIVRIDVHYYTYLETIINLPPELEKPKPELPSPIDDSRHNENINIPSGYKRITFIYNSTANTYFRYRYSDNGIIYNEYQYLSNGDSITVALNNSGKFEWDLVGVHNFKAIKNKNNNIIYDLSYNHNDIYVIEVT